MLVTVTGTRLYNARSRCLSKMYMIVSFIGVLFKFYLLLFNMPTSLLFSLSLLHRAFDLNSLFISPTYALVNR